MADTLTGLLQRDEVLQRLSTAPTGARLEVLYVDVDAFKSVNDRFGHLAGDQLLVQVGDRMGDVLAGLQPHALARIGGDEFVAAVVDSSVPVSAVGCEQATAVGPPAAARRMAERLREPYLLDGTSVRCSASVGSAHAVAPVDGLAVLRQADLAMYEAKRRGGGRACCFSPLLVENAIQRSRTSRRVVAAIDEGRLSILFQPVVSLATGDPEWAEGLLRMPDPSLASFGTAELLRMAADAGRDVAASVWVIDRAIDHAATAASSGPVSISINIPARHLVERVVQECLARAADCAPAVAIEVTQAHEMAESDLAATLACLGRVRDQGNRLFLDGVGTKDAPLEVWSAFSWDGIKVPRPVVAAGATARGRALLAALAGMASSCGQQTVAVGVQTAAEVTMLSDLGVGYAQGHFFGSAADSTDLTAAHA